MRRIAAAALLAVLAAGCGSSGRPAPPQPPRLPHALGRTWARQADAVAAALAAGDGCTAHDRASRLQQDVIAAINGGRVPHRLLEPLSSGVNDLAGRITCTPPPPATPTEPAGGGGGNEHGPAGGHGKGKGHDEGKGKGHGKGRG